MTILVGQFGGFVLPVLRYPSRPKIRLLHVGIALLWSATSVASRIWPDIGREPAFHSCYSALLPCVSHHQAASITQIVAVSIVQRYTEISFSAHGFLVSMSRKVKCWDNDFYNPQRLHSALQ